MAGRQAGRLQVQRGMPHLVCILLGILAAALCRSELLLKLFKLLVHLAPPLVIHLFELCKVASVHHRAKQHKCSVIVKSTPVRGDIFCMVDEPVLGDPMVPGSKA